MTQSQQILSALKNGKHITPLYALTEFKCFRLGARIWDLKQDGHDIATTRVETHGGAMVASYSLIKEAQGELGVRAAL